MATEALFAPKVRYTSTSESQFDAAMTWRAELELSYLVEDEAPDVVAGYAEFVIVRVGEHPIADLLDSLSEDAAEFVELFDGDDVAAAVQEQFEDAPFNRVLIITTVNVGAPVRGHGLGAWLVAEVIDKMTSPTDTLVLLRPHPAELSNDSESAAGQARSRYWQKVGLEPVGDKFLAAATAYSHLSRARSALSSIADIQVAVPASQIGPEHTRDFSRHTVLAEAGPRRLRIVHD